MKLSRFVLLFALLVLYCKAYEIILFSDVHLDGPEYRSENISAGQQRALKRNMASWEKGLPEILRSANSYSKENNVEFAVVLGDLIHGHFASPTLHAQGLEKILEILQTELSNTQVFVVKGNHDVVGAFGRDAFQASLRPIMHKSFKQEGIGVGPANYTLTKENDLFIFFDCMEPDLKFVEKALAAAPDARHVFFFTHYPVIPSSPNGGATVVFGGGDEASKRSALLELLAKRNTMVFCGHIHRTTYSRYKVDEGQIIQLSLFSLLPPNSPDFKVIAEGDGQLYFEQARVATALEAQKAAGKIIKEFEGKISEWGDYGHAAGFTAVEIDENVKVNIHYKGAKEANKTIIFK